MFKIPNIQGQNFTAGNQPFNPGVPPSNWAGYMGLQFVPAIWPGIVPVINALANNPGVACNRAMTPLVNNYAPLPTENLFIGGINGKSQG